MKPAQRAKLFNAVAEAWNKGQAPWAYLDGSSGAVRIWGEAYSEASTRDYRRDAGVVGPGPSIDAHEALHLADLAVARWAVAQGLDLPRSLRG